MAYVITPACIKTGACLNTCPSHAIHPTTSESDWSNVPQLYVNPSSCSDCGNCLMACPEGAAMSEMDASPEVVAANAAYYNLNLKAA